MANIIEPKVLKGFRDFLPAAEIERRDIIACIESVYQSYGYVPIDTPALEYTEILLGKGGGETEKQIYRFTDAGGRDISLRFDLTVPLARFTAAHLDELPMPFKRYHIAKVWRGENTQRGRYREFMQCDCDALGEDSAFADFEILCMMRDALSAARCGAVVIHVNHRGLFNRFLEKIGIRDKSAEILRAVDKFAKIGRAETEALLAAAADAAGAAAGAGGGGADAGGGNGAGAAAGGAGGGGKKIAGDILNYIESSGSWGETLDRLTAFAGGPCPESERLRTIYAMLEDAGIAESFKLDPSITRGLDYYTGIVYESFLAELPGIGSVCSGGRYDDLAGLYTRRKISGVGASVGLDRLIAALAALGRGQTRRTYTRLVIAAPDGRQGGACQRLASLFRSAGIPCEIMSAGAEKLTALYMNAEKRGAPYVLIPSGGGLSAENGGLSAEDGFGGGLTLRELAARKNTEGLTVDAVINIIRKA